MHMHTHVMFHNVGSFALGRCTTRCFSCQLCEIGTEVDGGTHELTRSCDNSMSNNNTTSRISSCEWVHCARVPYTIGQLVRNDA